MKPPTGGPSTGPISAGIVTQVMTATISRLSKLRSMTRRPTGDIMAPPMPCTKRAITKSLSECAMAQPIEPTHEDRNGDAKHVARAESVGSPAAGRNEDGKRQQVGRDRELERQRIGADIGRDRRQCGRDHGRIHVLHEQGDGDDERHDAGAKHASGAGWLGGRDANLAGSGATARRLPLRHARPTCAPTRDSRAICTVCAFFHSARVLSALANSA